MKYVKYFINLVIIVNYLDNFNKNNYMILLFYKSSTISFTLSIIALYFNYSTQKDGKAA